MSKKAVSVTLDTDNLAWLQGQIVATRARGLSETLDRIVSEARRSGRVDDRAIRSVVGTIEINPEDPNLEHADAYVRSLFDESLTRPVLVRERSAQSYGSRPASRKGRRRRG